MSDIASPLNVGDDSMAYDGDIGSASTDSDDRPLISLFNVVDNVDTNEDISEEATETIIVIATDGDLDIDDGDNVIASSDGDNTDPAIAAVVQEATE